MDNNTVTYCNCMSQIRQRTGVVQGVLNRTITTGHDVFDTELIFVQFRKILELIAFSTLTANKEKYSLVHANFAVHWKAKSMLEAVGKLNPNFYPVPLGPPELLPNGVKQFTPLAEGFLTKDEFELLYNKSSEILHERNPFTAKDPVIQIGYSVAQWIVRIQTLLAFHKVDLIDESKWMVEIPNEGAVKLWPAVPVDSITDQPKPVSL
jgi:hypothetical protein